MGVWESLLYRACWALRVRTSTYCYIYILYIYWQDAISVPIASTHGLTYEHHVFFRLKVFIWQMFRTKLVLFCFSKWEIQRELFPVLCHLRFNPSGRPCGTTETADGTHGWSLGDGGQNTRTNSEKDHKKEVWAGPLKKRHPF